MIEFVRAQIRPLIMPPTNAKPTKRLKRPASSQAGPEPKKPHLDNSAKRPAVAKDHPKPKPKSRRPVTDDHDSDSGTSSDDEKEVDDDGVTQLAQDPNGLSQNIFQQFFIYLFVVGVKDIRRSVPCTISVGHSNPIPRSLHAPKPSGHPRDRKMSLRQSARSTSVR